MGIHPLTTSMALVVIVLTGIQAARTEDPRVAIAGVAVAFLLIVGLRVAQQWQQAIVLRIGKFHRVQSSGMFTVIPFVDTIPYWIDMRTITTPFAAEQTLTKDSVPVDVDAVLFWRVVDAAKAALEVENYREAIAWASQTALRDVIGESDLSDMLMGRAAIDARLCEIIDARTEAWGIKALAVEIRDVKIPTGLQDAMSMQAQAERERQARVILADSERQIADRFAESAKAYRDDPVALHLRAMNILLEGMRQNSTVILVPSTAVETMGLGAMAGITSLAKEFGGVKKAS